MTLIPRSLVTTFQETVDELNEHTDNGGLGRHILLLFEGGLEIASNTSTISLPALNKSIGLTYGGKSSPSSTANRDGLTNPTDSVVEREISKIVTGRIYAVTKPYLRISLGITKEQDVYQLNIHKKFLPDLLRAKEAIFDTDFAEQRVRVRLWKPPVPYGLAEAHQCKSFWEKIG